MCRSLDNQLQHLWTRFSGTFWMLVEACLDELQMRSILDGYLGTITSRRDDRLLDNLKARQNERSYQRGVHKGERIDPGDYFEPPEWNMMTGIRRQMVSDKRLSLAGEYPQHLAGEGWFHAQPIPRGSESVLTLDPKRREQLAHLMPSWR